MRFLGEFDSIFLVIMDILRECFNGVIDRFIILFDEGMEDV